jgi:hypothetical protein
MIEFCIYLWNSREWQVDWKPYVGKLLEQSNIKNLELILALP